MTHRRQRSSGRSMINPQSMYGFAKRITINLVALTDKGAPIRVKSGAQEGSRMKERRLSRQNSSHHRCYPTQHFSPNRRNVVGAENQRINNDWDTSGHEARPHQPWPEVPNGQHISEPLSQTETNVIGTVSHWSVISRV